MADVNGLNYAQTLDLKAPKVDPGEKNGRIKILQEKFTFAAELTALDVVLGMNLPKGAKIVDAKMIAPAGFTAGTFSLGLGATTDSSDVAIVEDLNSIILATNFAAAARADMSPASPMWGVKLGSEAQLKAECTVTTTGATGLDLFMQVEYVVD